MKKLSILFILIFMSSFAWAINWNAQRIAMSARKLIVGTPSTYYVSTSGDDTNNGTSDATPWRHHPWMDGATSTADSTVLSSGDIVYFKKGETFTATDERMNECDNGVTDYITMETKSDWGTGDNALLAPMREWTSGWSSTDISNVYMHTVTANFGWLFWGSISTPGDMVEHMLDLSTNHEFAYAAYGTIPYDNLSGTFTIGETITGGTNSYTAKVIGDNGSTLVVEEYSAIKSAYYNDNETLTGGSSGATADVNGSSKPATYLEVAVYSDTDLTSTPGTILYSGGSDYGPFTSDGNASGFKYHRWKNMRFWGGGEGGLYYTQPDDAGVSSGYIEIDSCEFKYNGTGSMADNFNTAGVVIGIQTGYAGTVQDVVIKDSTFDEMARRGIMIGRLDSGTNEILRNTITDLRGEHYVYYARPVGIYTAETEGLLIEDNSIIYRTGESSSNIYTVGLWNMESLTSGGNNTIHRNYVKNFGVGLYSEVGESTDLWEANLVESIGFGIYISCTTGPEHCGGVKWYNNTINNSSNWGIYHTGGQKISTEMIFKNNLVVPTSGQLARVEAGSGNDGTITFDYNAYEVAPATATMFRWEAVDMSFETWDNSRDANAQCDADLNVDAVGKLESGSECIDNGVDLGTANGLDVDSTWPSGVLPLDRDSYGSWDIGAYVDASTNYIDDANCMFAGYMNGDGTNETDRSGEGGTLSQSGGDTIPTSATVPSGFSGTSRDFESTETEYLYHADGNSTDISGADQPITIAAWIRGENDTGANSYIVSKYKAAVGSRQYTLFYSDGSAVFVCTMSSDGTAYTQALGVTNINYGTWQHVACVYNDTDIRVYVDGSLDSNGADNPKAYTSGIYNGDQSFRVGAGNAEKYFDGLIDEVIVFDRALSAAEISEMYNNGIDGTKGGND